MYFGWQQKENFVASAAVLERLYFSLSSPPEYGGFSPSRSIIGTDHFKEQRRLPGFFWGSTSQPSLPQRPELVVTVVIAHSQLQRILRTTSRRQACLI